MPPIDERLVSGRADRDKERKKAERENGVQVSTRITSAFRQLEPGVFDIVPVQTNSQMGEQHEWKRSVGVMKKTTEVAETLAVADDDPHKEAKRNALRVWNLLLDEKCSLLRLHQKALTHMPVRLSTDVDFKKWLRKLRTVQEQVEWLKQEELRLKKERDAAKAKGLPVKAEGETPNQPTIKYAYNDPGYWWSDAERKQALEALEVVLADCRRHKEKALQLHQELLKAIDAIPVPQDGKQEAAPVTENGAQSPATAAKDTTPANAMGDKDDEWRQEDHPRRKPSSSGWEAKETVDEVEVFSDDTTSSDSEEDSKANAVRRARRQAKQEKRARAQPKPSERGLNIPPVSRSFVTCLSTMLTPEERGKKKEEEQKKREREVVRARALKRLWRDWREVSKQPLPTVTAEPLMHNNFFEWHANVMGVPGTDWDGVVFHLVMRFPDDYPNNPPKVRMCTPIAAKSVFGGYICLDLLVSKDNLAFWAPYADEEIKSGSTGWSSAYTVQTLLIQLQSFFMERVHKRKPLPDRDDFFKDCPTKLKPSRELAYRAAVREVESWNKYIDQCIAWARKAKCECGHKGTRPYPVFRAQYYQHNNYGVGAQTAAKARLRELKELQRRRRRHGSESEDEEERIKSKLAKKKESEAKAEREREQKKLVEQQSEARRAKAQTGGLDVSKALAAMESAAAAAAAEQVKRRQEQCKKPIYKMPKLTPQQLKQLRPGLKIRGVVTRVEAFGVFVDVGWYRDGLIHVSKLADGFVEDPFSVLRRGDKILVLVDQLDEAMQRLSLSRRFPAPQPRPAAAAASSSSSTTTTTPAALRGPVSTGSAAPSTSSPSSAAAASSASSAKAGRGRVRNVKWTLAALKEGQELTGLVVHMTNSAAYVDVASEVDGFLHVKDMPDAIGGTAVWEPQQILKLRQTIPVTVTRVDPPRRRLWLKARPFPHVTSAAQDRQRACAAKSAEKLLRPFRNSSLKHLYQDETQLVLSFLDRASLRAVASVCAYFEKYAEVALSTYFTRDELVCFHSRVCFEEDTLGHGVTLEHYQNNGDLDRIVPNFDLIARGSFFKEQIRLSAFQQPFTHWLPLYINRYHAKNLRVHEKVVAELCKNKFARHEENAFHVKQILKILPAVMNTMVVDIMDDKKEMHHSIVALQGYLTFFHLLLAFCEKYPELQSVIDKRFEFLLKSERGRNKRACPNLGELLALLAASTYTWKQVGSTIVREVFDRNVKWVIIQYPELVDLASLPPTKPAFTDVNSLRVLAKYGVLNKDVAEAKIKTLMSETKAHESEVQQLEKLDRGRLPKTWKATLVSNRLVMFHVLFLKLFRQDEFGADITPQQAKLHLDACYGRSTTRLQDRLQRNVKQILAVNSWTGYFKRLQMPVPRPEFLCTWLRQAALNSAAKRYHDPEAVKKALDAQKEAERKAKKKVRQSQAMMLDGMLDDEDMSSTSLRQISSANREEYFGGGESKNVPKHKYYQ